MDPTYHMMSMLRAMDALPKGWFENNWLSRIRLASGLLGVLFLGIFIISVIFLAFDFQAMRIEMYIQLGAEATTNPAGLAMTFAIGVAAVSLLLAVVSFFIDYLCRNIQRRNLFITGLKKNIGDFARSYEPDSMILEA